MIDPDAPYALADLHERTRREALLAEAHMVPLETYLRQLRSDLGEQYDMPCFDPCDGGVYANVLILLEAPGPKSVDSTFISRNNPDPTAKNMCNLLSEAGIPRKDTLIWNTVPFYVGDNGRIRAVTDKDIEVSMPYLASLISVMPKLRLSYSWEI